MSGISIELAEDRPYGPGNPDYDNDGRDVQGITYNDELHEYRLDGRVVPSVTQVLEPVRRELGGSQSVLEHKRQIGKALDAAIEITERGEEIDLATLHDDVVPFFQAWLKFKEQSGFRVLFNQPIVFSRLLRVAGRPDLIGTRDGNTYELVDTKCVWTMDPATAIQTAGYTLLAHESLGIRIPKRSGLQLLRDGTYRLHPYADQNDAQVFKACLSVFGWLSTQRKA